MAEEQSNAGAQAQGNSVQFSLQKIYVKDVSFESPGAPEIFQEQGQQALNMNLGQKVNNVSEGVFEVVLTVTVTSKIEEKVVFLAEVQQAGIFGIAGIQEEQLNQLLGAYCPNVLFPYARQMISELVANGGFQPLYLQPVNFEQLYAQQLQQRQQEQAGNA